MNEYKMSWFSENSEVGSQLIKLHGGRITSIETRNGLSAITFRSYRDIRTKVNHAYNLYKGAEAAINGKA